MPVLSQKVLGKNAWVKTFPISPLTIWQQLSWFFPFSSFSHPQIKTLISFNFLSTGHSVQSFTPNAFCFVNRKTKSLTRNFAEGFTAACWFWALRLVEMFSSPVRPGRVLSGVHLEHWYKNLHSACRFFFSPLWFVVVVYQALQLPTWILLEELWLFFVHLSHEPVCSPWSLPWYCPTFQGSPRFLNWC